MRSINSFQNNQNHPYFINLNNTNQKSLSSLASQYMDMFDPLKANTSLLQKRERQNVEGFYQNEIQKKVKTIMGPRECGPLNAMPNLATMLFQQNLPLNQAFQNFPLNTESFNQQLKLNSLRNFQQIQNMKQQQETLQLLQSQLFNNDNNKSSLNFLVKTQKPMKTMEEVKVKEEYVKQEEVPLSKGSSELEKLKMVDCLSENNTTNDSLSEASADKNDFFMPSPTRDEPILAEYTKAFPEWDLATIFSFIKSGKSIETFEKERKFKMERKLKKQRTSANKSKQSKTKKANNL